MAARTLELAKGKGAQFWVYISPQNNTASVVTKWSVTYTHKDSNWVGTITSDNPTEILQTPGLSGLFDVKAQASGPDFGPVELHPSEGGPVIGCNDNCSSFVGILADPDGKGASYWTTWDAICA
jgi:hypothetical protein